MHQVEIPSLKMHMDGIFLVVEEDEFPVGIHPARTVEVTIMNSTAIAGIPHETFKRQFSAMTGLPMNEIVRVYNYGQVKIWYATILSEEKYEALNMRVFGARRRRGEQGERFTIYKFVTKHVDKKG